MARIFSLKQIWIISHNPLKIFEWFEWFVFLNNSSKPEHEQLEWNESFSLKQIWIINLYPFKIFGWFEWFVFLNNSFKPEHALGDVRRRLQRQEYLEWNESFSMLLRSRNQRKSFRKSLEPDGSERWKAKGEMWNVRCERWKVRFLARKSLRFLYVF